MSFHSFKSESFDPGLVIFLMDADTQQFDNNMSQAEKAFAKI